MKGTDKKDIGSTRDVLEELFAHATARERPPREDAEAIHEALHAQWKEMTRQRKRRKNRFVFALAASLVLGVYLVTLLQQSPVTTQPAVQVATVGKVMGTAVVAVEGESPAKLLQIDSELQTGQVISTGLEARLGFAWENGIHLRMDQNGKIRIVSPTEIELLSGRLYVDTDDMENPMDSLSIATPAGPLRHVGTRYMAAVNRGTTSVSVRDGQVRFEQLDLVASDGELLVFDTSGAVSREAIARYGERWEWTESLSSPFTASGRSLSDFIGWVAHETGRAVVFTSAETERLALDSELRGTVNLPPMEALARVMQTTDLVCQAQEGVLVVSLDKAR